MYVADGADTVSMQRNEAAKADYSESQPYSFWDTLERVASLAADGTEFSRPQVVEFSERAASSDRFGAERIVEPAVERPPRLEAAAGEPAAGLPPQPGPVAGEPAGADSAADGGQAAKDDVPMKVYGQIRTLLADVDELGSVPAAVANPTPYSEAAAARLDPEAGSEFLASLERKNRTFDKTGEIDVDLDRVAAKLDWSRGDDDVVIKRRRGRKRK